jgi:hypothetical protein
MTANTERSYARAHFVHRGGRWWQALARYFAVRGVPERMGDPYSDGQVFPRWEIMAALREANPSPTRKKRDPDVIVDG